MKSIALSRTYSLLACTVLVMTSLNAEEAAHSQATSMDWSQLKEHGDCFDGQKVKVKGYVHKQEGEFYLTAMASGACCSSDSCENKVHLVGAKENFANVDSQKPVTVEGSAHQAGHACCREKACDESGHSDKDSHKCCDGHHHHHGKKGHDHKHHDKECCSHDSCSSHDHEKQSACCALIDMEDPYLVDDDGASSTYGSIVIAAILAGVAIIFAYQTVASKKK